LSSGDAPAPLDHPERDGADADSRWNLDSHRILDGSLMRDLELIATFLAVYRAGSLTAAAEDLGLSQPSVSERVARLERDLDVALFDRSRRGVTPTPEADRLATRVAAPVDQLRLVWTTPVGEPSGLVRIGSASDVTATRIIPALAPLARDGLRMTFTLGLASELLERLTEGGLDLVVSSIRPRHPALRYRRLIDEEFVLVGAPALARTVDAGRVRGDPLGALSHLPLVAYDDQLSIVRRYWRSQFDKAPPNPVAIVVPDLRAVLAAVVAGAGISALPRYLAEPAILGGSLEVLHTSDELPINTLFLALRAGVALPPATTRVRDALVAQAAGWSVF
jgi:DNA-binding transcriptional LysR family regulator